MYDIAVIGGGVLGTFAAYHACRSGKKVILIERDKKPQSASVRNFGQVVPSGLNSAWRPYGRKSLEIYRELQQLGDFSIVNQGSLYVASDAFEQALIEEQYEINKNELYPVELLAADTLHHNYPFLKKTYARAGLFYPEELSVDPMRLVYALHQYLSAQQNCKVSYQTLAMEVNDRGSHCEIASNFKEIIRAGRVVICSGSEYQLLYPERYTQADIKNVKLHMMMTKAQSQVRISPNVLTGLSIRRYESFRECAAYAQVAQRNSTDERTNDWGIHILFKQTLTGEVIIGDSHEYKRIQDDEEFSFFCRADINEYILDLAREIITLDTWQIAQSWYGIYSQTAAGDIHRDQVGDKIFILNAIGGKGMTAAPGYTFYYMQQLLES